MYVDSWARRRTYTAFKEALGSGVRHHLQVRAGECVCSLSSLVAEARGVVKDASEEGVTSYS